MVAAVLGFAAQRHLDVQPGVLPAARGDEPCRGRGRRARLDSGWRCLGLALLHADGASAHLHGEVPGPRGRRDIILADWSQYAIAQKAGGIKAASSIHLYFNYDKQVFRFVLRYDGQPTWAIDLTPRRGPTVSPFVVLATRP